MKKVRYMRIMKTSAAMMPAPFSSVTPFVVTFQVFRSTVFSRSSPTDAGRPRSAIFWCRIVRLIASFSCVSAMNSETEIE